MIDIFVFGMGLVVGSFLNVCIHRLPKDESIVRPRSFCPKCGKSIAWFDNVPVLSYLLLGGRCRQCRERISLRYPAVELISALIWYISWRQFGVVPMFWIHVVFLSLLLIVSLADLETGLIPDEVSFLGMAAGLAASFLTPELQANTVPLTAVGKSLLGMLTGGGLIFVTGLAGDWIFQRESMGGGDVKLMAMAGCFLGWEKSLLVFFTAPLLALPFALYQRLVKKEEVIPYGPFLSLAAAAHFFYGDWFWRLVIFGRVV